MSKHLMTVAALCALSLVGSPVRADTSDQRAHQHLKAYLGVRVDTAAQGDRQENGVTVREVNPNSPAAKAGLQKGDVIRRVGQRVIEDYADLSNAITRHQPGEGATIQVRRKGEDKTLRITLSEQTARWMPGVEDGQNERLGRQEDQQREGRVQGGDLNRDYQRLSRRLQQMEERLQNRDQANQRGRTDAGRQANYLGLRTRTRDDNDEQGGTKDEGVQITQVDSDSAAARAGLRQGDVITAVNGRDISTPQELRQRVQRAGNDREITLEIRRGDDRKEVRVRPERRSGNGEDMQALQQLARRIDQLENRVRERVESNGDRQDRYGRWQGNESVEDGNLQRMQRRLDRMEQRVREMEQRSQSGRQRD